MQSLSAQATLELARRNGAKPRRKVIAYFDGVTPTDITTYVERTGTISTSRGSLLKEFEAGDCTLTLSNSGKEFCPEVSGSLLNGKRYHGQRVEISAGLELPDGSTEYIPQFVGKIQRLNLDSGKAKAHLLIRGILKQLMEARIAKPNVAVNGATSPNPLDVPMGFSTLTTTTNPADAILQIATAAGLDADDLDTASFDAARTATAHMNLGMTFGADGNAVSAIAAMREFAQACLGTLYVNESGKLCFYVYAGQDITGSPMVFSWDSNIDSEGVKPTYDIEAVKNKIAVRYGPSLDTAYPPSGQTCEDADSIAAYGERTVSSSGYLDCKAIITEADARWLAEYILDAFKEPPLVITCTTDFDALPVQITDTVLVSDPNVGIESLPMEVLRREFDSDACECGFELRKSNTRLLWFTLDDDGPAGELDGDAMLL